VARYRATVTTFDLRALRLSGGGQARERVEIALEPLLLGGQAYEQRPNPVPAELTVTRASSGAVFELALGVTVRGPCVRCLGAAEVPLALRLREYQAARPETEELGTEYLADERLDLSRWAGDAVALALPDKVLCRPACAGLCPLCGRDLNVDPHEHATSAVDPRWAALESLREPT
jgi:uncharacterized protein